MKVVCAYCKGECNKSTGHVNRANKIGAPLYCNKICAGLGRRVNRTIEEKKKIKADYDKQYLKKNFEVKKKKMQVYNASPAGRAMQKRNRDKFKQSHLEYCRTPEYRKWKAEYDKKHFAKKNYREFAECFLLIKEIEKEYNQQEVRQINNLHNKSQKRKRKWKQNKNYLQRT